MIVPVDSASHEALAPYARVRERDLARGAERLFVAEGEMVVRVLAGQSRFRTRSLLLEERRVSAMRDVLDARPEVPAYVVPQSVMNEVVGFEIHRGILALGERGPELDARELVKDKPLVVALVGLTNHDNVGGVFRNAAAFGAGAVLLDRATCDPLYRKAIRVSVGGALVVPFARTDDVLASLEGFTLFALTPRGEESLDVLSLAPEPGRRALLLGTEGDGLPDDVLARTRRVRIAMSGALDSLNVAVASGVALHEATRPRR
jgi:tRNA G18 (ribose-2'-O)-methylase SpoU